MTLHDAISTVIRKNPEPMRARDIAHEINKYSLYKKKGDNLVSTNQVWARANKYKALFRITEDKRISENSIKTLLMEDFSKWLRNFLVHNYSANFDIILPYLVFYMRREGLLNFSDNVNHLGYFDLIRTDSPRQNIINSIDSLSSPQIPTDFFKILKNGFGQLDETSLKNILFSFERFYSLFTELNDNDFKELFEKLISQVSGSKSRGFEFSTPKVISKLIKQLVELRPQQSIFDPFAGLCILLNTVVDGQNKIQVSANDVNEKLGIVGILNLILHGVSDFNYTFHDAFLNPQKDLKYDWIVSNPPFTVPSGPMAQNIYPFETSVSYIYNSLKSRGRGIVVIPDSFLYSEDKKYNRLRKKLVGDKSIRAILSLPNGIFQPYTSVATSVLFIDKTNSKEGIFFSDFSNLSIDELDYKIEEYANIVNRRKNINGTAAFITYEDLKMDNYFNLLPRKNILQRFSDHSYSENSIVLKDIIEKRIKGQWFSSPNLNEEQDGIPYLRISDLATEANVPYILSTPSKFVSDLEETKSFSLIEENNIVIAKYGNFLNPLIYKLKEKSLVSNNLFCFSVKKNVALPEYLVEEFKKDYMKQQLEAIQIRGAGPNYYRERDLLNLRIVIPTLVEQKLSIEEKTSSLSNFLVKTREGLVELFKKEVEKADTSEKPVKEGEIISSIKHRIAQYVSPISNDLKNLEYYFARKLEDRTPFVDSDRISGRENALLVSEVFNRVNKNLSGIGETFDVMKNILYFDREDSTFSPNNIESIVIEAYDSVKDRLPGVLFNFTIDETLQTKDLSVPIDKIQIVELLRNFFINSVKHGFDDTIPNKIVNIFISKDSSNNFLELNLINNGKPFPDGFTIEDFTAFGTKGTNSVGTGIGGYLMKKIVDNHGGILEWHGEDNFRFTIEKTSGEMISSIATIHFKILLPYINN